MSMTEQPTDSSGATAIGIAQFAPDTVASVGAATMTAAGGDLAALAAAVTDASQTAAPAGEVEQWIKAAETRFQALEAAAGKILPFISELTTAVAPVVSAIDPAAGVVLARLPAIESTLSALLDALNGHFGLGKIVGLPATLPPVVSGA